MGIAAYNRGTRALSAYIDQQQREARIVKVSKPVRLWAPPPGWFQAAQQERDERGEYERRVQDNERRRQYGLPTYEP